MLRHEGPANGTPRHLPRFGNCNVFSLARLDAFKCVSSLQLSPGRQLILRAPCSPVAFGLYPSISLLPSTLAAPTVMSSSSSIPSWCSLGAAGG